ncbi:hypothetical protein CDL12_04006 [Handroanthus impetiginosus]|uniref:Uncharacterized protein n=1 Tax=Handroanthus impetiginosus TaxID=429701 RepID=A0A2G9I0W4_9LAMI|nr:hypothetical protein CDL12_04006 [Handroanthus impetiginosus]
MEEFDDGDDFSDLYADVEVQASSAISAMHGLAGMPPVDGGILSNDNDDFPQLAGEKGGVFECGIRGKEEENVFSKTEIAVGNGGSYGNATGVEGAGKYVEGGRDIVLNDSSDGKKQRKQKFADNPDNSSNCTRKNGIEVGVKNARKPGGEEIEEEEKNEGGGIHGNEKNLNAGGCHSQRKDKGSHSVAVSSNLKGNGSVRADWKDNERGHLMDGNPFVGRGQSFWRSQSRGSRHTPACGCTSSDLDKYGSVQISDSEEDNHHKQSDSDSDGMAEEVETHNGTDIRKSSSKSDKALSVLEPDLSCSPSPHQAVSNDGTGRSHKHSEKTSLSSDSELWNLTTCDYRTSKDSESHRVKPNTRDGRYYERDRGRKGRSHKHSKRPLTSRDSEMPESFLCDYRPLKISKSHGVTPNTREDRYYERDRDPIRKDLKLQRRSNHVSTSKTHMNDEGAYDGFDIRGPYDIHRSKTGHGKRAFLNYNEKDMPYCKGPEGYSTYFQGSSPNYHSAYLKNQYWKVHPSFECEAGGSDDYNMNEKQNFVKR